ncbi:LuxR C-terminal-related transcriptional regulator [Aminobacter aganoensis]|uniref:DNA-binding CsgD family transcriptional regulator n=1 Tax=Aminobacter aganoensis TaxID=83264 RepID=A0A7X0KMK7_9HYPH|nr:helix-turn-helix transcriptional regulator [Aminobacter aganoensis]MBB6356221.1 DNA-binding CsgD family transcriptional regulator [Aminobacter aganoensis]
MDQDALTIALGGLAREIGEPCFHHRLLELVGNLLPHEMGWIVRYRPGCDPDVLHTKAIDAALVEYYLQTKPAAGDPYLCSWRGNSLPRVETLDAALPQAIDRNFYAFDFKKRAEFTDELALFLPVPGTACISLFLERRERMFASDELDRLRRVFPAMLDFHHAHIRSLFGRLSMAIADCHSIEDSAVVVLDRAGRSVFTTPGWKKLGERDRWVGKLAQASSRADISEMVLQAPSFLRSLALDEANPVAPGGVVLYVAGASDEADGSSVRAARDVADQLTPRERDIMLLTLDGLSTGAIAQQLNIAKGSIKNCRLRMYRKLGVSSERAMISAMMPFTRQLRARLEDERSAR